MALLYVGFLLFCQCIAVVVLACIPSVLYVIHDMFQLFVSISYMHCVHYTPTQLDRTGPLAWAIVTWRNSMVFHSLDKITSMFIHITPTLGKLIPTIFHLHFAYSMK